jgi:hypothetical protein
MSDRAPDDAAWTGADPGSGEAQGAAEGDGPVKRATGRGLPEWFTLLDERGARDLPHKDIARLLNAEYGVPGWWSQNVTVEYERHIGRRETGQGQDGRYEGTATRTLPGSMDEVLDRWTERLPEDPAAITFDGIELAGEPSVSRTEKWRYWRAPLADGSRVTVTIGEKPGGAAGAGGPASTLAVTSSKLTTRDEAARWKTFWRAYLAEF